MNSIEKQCNELIDEYEKLLSQREELKNDVLRIVPSKRHLGLNMAFERNEEVFERCEIQCKKLENEWKCKPLTKSMLKRMSKIVKEGNLANTYLSIELDYYLNHHANSKAHDNNNDQTYFKFNRSTKSNVEGNIISHQTDSYFSECNTVDEITQRYHELCKIYHPDNINGNTEIFCIIQNDYQRLMKEFIKE